MKTKPYQALVFDWDGTLVDSIARITTSLQHAGEQVCGVEVSADAARHVIGLGLHEAIRHLHPTLAASEINAICEAYKQHYVHESEIAAPLFPGVTDLLEHLRSQGYTLAIATGKSRIGLDHSLASHGLSHYFSSTRCAGENRSKPHPEMLLGVLQDIGINTQQALMIGDSEHDMLMANNAGVKAIAVSHGAHTAENLLKHQPLVCLDQITELSGFLNHNHVSL